MKKKIFSAITLIEVMITIYIFGIGILVILQMLLSNIVRLYDLRAKDTAVSLAKEGMDLVFFHRDSNIEKGMNRDCAGIQNVAGSRSCAGSLLTTGLNMYTVNRSLTGLYAFTSITDTGDAVLWYHTGTLYTLSGTNYTGFWYNHDETSGSPTPYNRWIEIFPQTTYPSDTGYVLGVRSIVEYQRGSRTQRITLESIVGDMR